MTTSPNYRPGVGRLVADRFDLQKHVDGYNMHHVAGSVDMFPAVTIDGYTVNNVQQAIARLANYAVPPTVVYDATSSVKGILKLTGDLGGTAASPTVTRLQGRSVTSSAPTSGQVLGWNGSVWGPTNVSTSSTTEELYNKTILLEYNTIKMGPSGNAEGDILYYSVSQSRYMNMSKGANGTVLGVSGGTLQYVTLPTPTFESSLQVSDGNGQFRPTYNLHAGDGYIRLGGTGHSTAQLRTDYGIKTILGTRTSGGSDLDLIARTDSTTIRLGPATTTDANMAINGKTISINAGYAFALYDSGSNKSIELTNNNNLNFYYPLNGTQQAIAINNTGEILMYSNSGALGLKLDTSSDSAGTNAMFFGTQTITGGIKSMIYIANTTQGPIVGHNPTGGGFLYTYQGGLYYQGSSGTVTPLAVA